MVTGTVQDLIDDAIRLINEDINTPIPLLKRDEWQKGRNAKARANREEQRANNAESRLSMMERFVRQVGASEAFTHWSLLTKMVDKAINAFNAWTHNTASVFSRNDERVIGQDIIAKCQLEGLNPVSDTDRKAAASSIAEMAEKNVGSISQFMWDTALLRIGQLASEMRVSMRDQSVGGSNGNVDELTNWNRTKKRGQGI